MQTHDDIMQMHGDIMQTHDDIMQTHDDVMQTHGDIMQTHGDIMQTHGDVMQMHGDVIMQTHGDIMQTHDDIMQTHDDIMQTHDDIMQTHGDIMQTHGDIMQTHGDVMQTHGDVMQTHGDIMQTHDDIMQTHGDIMQTHGDVMKKSAAPTLAEIEQLQQQSLNNKGIKLQGKLIYFDGKLAMELSEGAAAFKGFTTLQNQPTITQSLGEATLRGEILDPKCYLGVMRPGEGKPHRSCAIRCIEGGIPPFFKVVTKEDAHQYFFVLDANGNPVNDKVAKYVADEVQLCGTVEQWDDWYVVKMDMNQGFQVLQSYWTKAQDIPMCYSR
jgi:hypothetical protein